MKQKTRKALSWLLSLAMVLSLIPGMSLTAWADDVAISSLWIGSSSEIKTSGDVGSVGQTSGTATVSTENGSIVLELNNFTFNAAGHTDTANNPNSACIFYEGTTPLIIKLTGTNTITTSAVDSGNNFGIYSFKSAATVTIKGPGTLTVKSGNAGSNTSGIRTGGEVTFVDCAVSATGGSSSNTSGTNAGIDAGGYITVDGANLTATSGTGNAKLYGIKAYSGSSGPCNIIVKSGTVTATGNTSALYYNSEERKTSLKIADGSTLSTLNAGEATESASDVELSAVANQKCVYAVATAPLDPVASVTTYNGTATEYTDFAEAVTAWNTASNTLISNTYKAGATLKLLADVETSNSVKPTVSCSSDYPMILDLNGYGIRYTGEEKASVIYVEERSGLNLKMKDSNPNRVHYIKLDSNGRGIAVSDTTSEGAIEVTGGYITGGNGGSSCGGGVHDMYSFVMEGGTIVGNTSNNGAGVRISQSGAAFTMTGGTITGNKASDAGGGVWFGSTCVFNLSGGTITGNIASSGGGGVYVTGRATFNLSGDASITGNLKGTEKNNVYLNNRKITITDALTNSDPIGVTMQTPGVFTEGGKAKDYAANFTSDNTAYSVVVDGNELKLAKPTISYQAASWDSANNKVTYTTQTCDSYTVVTSSTTSFENGKWYVVSETVEVPSRITVTGTANLILCDGATLTAQKGITVDSSATLNIYAQSEGDTAGKLVANADSYNAAIGGWSNDGRQGHDSGTINIHGGNLNVTGGYGAAAIGGGYNTTFTSVSIYGGTINATSGNDAGAAIGTGDGGNSAGKTITIYGGTVNATGVGCAAGIGGGGDSGAGTVTINGGTVTAKAGAGYNSNIPAGIGAGAYRRYNESVTINGGTVTAIGGSANAGGIGKNVNSRANVGTITLGAGVKLETSTDNSTWTDATSDTNTRTQYMRTSYTPSHTHSFAYAASGAVITATCGNHDGCPLADSQYKATLTIVAPQHTNVGDGKSSEATITDANNIKGSATVSYYAATKSGTTYTKSGSALGSAPTAAGNYVAEITLENKTAFVGYTISKTAQAAPTGFKSTPAATLYADGSINDGDPAINKTNLQVSSDGGKTWADVTQFPVSGKPGVYQFKYKETDALSESPVTSVLLEATNELREVKITSDKTDANIYKSGETNTLTAKTNSNVTGLALEFAWYREGVTEAVGTGATYTLQAADVGKKLTVAVTDKTTGATEPYTRVSTATPVIVTVAPTTYQITGNVKVPDAENSSTFNNVANANVELRQGNTVFATATTDSDGKYTFRSVSNGEYNIVVTEDGKTKTAYVKIENGNQTVDVEMPYYNVSSKVDVKGETPAAVVAGLDDAAADSLTNDEKAGGVTTTMTMEIESTDDLTAKADDQLTDEQKQEKNEQQAIKAQNTGTDKSDALDFIDMSVYKRTQKDGESAQVEDVHNLNKVLEILLPYATANRSFNIFRYHGTAAAKFTQLSTRPTGSFTDGKFFVGDGFIAIYASGFSTYAIGYSDSTTPSTPASTPSHSGGNGGYTATLTVPVSGDSASVSVSASVSGSTATVKAPTTAQLDKVIGESVKTGEVTIDVSGLNRNIATVSIPTETVKAIEKAVSDPNNDADALTVKLTDGSVTFDAAALAAITDQAKGSTIQLNLDGIAESGLRTAQKTAIKDMDVQAVYDAYLTSNGQRISDFKGGKATVTVSYTLKDGQIGRGVVVWYVAEDGKTTEVSTTYTSKEVTFTVEHFSNYVIAYDEARAAVCPQDNTCPISAFTDADPTAWYHDGVHYALENGIMSGYGNGKFGPDDNTSRAMVAQILWNMEGRPVVNYAMSYTDVDSEAWYTEAVRWATSEKIMSGYGGGKFDPGDAMTREQLVTILYRYAKRKGVDVSVGEDTNILSYDDAFDVSEWAIPAMQWAVGSGAVGGRTNTTLNPKDTATRAEIATIIMRYRTEIAK